MAYVDPQDIQQHVRGIGSVTVPAIIEIMTEIESYVSMRINMDPLPANNPVLKDIIRELTTAKVIADTLSPNAEQLARADFHRRNGLTMINDVNRDGLFPTSLGDRNIANEVYNPYPEPFFKAEDFAP